MSNQAHHVVPSLSGGWSVWKAGTTRASRHFDSKEAAVSWGREVSRRQHSEFVVHMRDGTVQVKVHHGDHPSPSQDRT